MVQPGRSTRKTILVAVRLPRDLYDRLAADDRSISSQVIDAVRAELARRDETAPQGWRWTGPASHG
jgi:post-segregation antitoxin (ccd killing protein)